jgi:predicted RNA-binding protein YlqC (UPF0109 family)
MKEFIEHLVKHLVDKPGEVFVNEIAGERTTVVEIRVGDGDTGKVIGRHGQTANAIRTLLAAVAAKQGQRSVLEILDRNKMKQSNGEHENSTVQMTAQVPVFESQSKGERRWQDDGGNNL